MKLLTSLAGSVPTSFTFHSAANPTSGKLSRLYFLGIPSKGRENTLLYADIIEDEHDKFVLPWKPLIDTLQPSWSSGQLSKEEQLMRERKRLGSYGITSYDFAEEGGRFVFPANSGLYVSRGGGLEDNPITAGSPSFVVQEEFDRYTGYWWQPNTDTLTSEGNQTLRILYEQVDESCVDILHIFGSSGLNESGVDEYRYPRAGTANAQSSLRLVEFQVNTFGPIWVDERQALVYFIACKDSPLENHLYVVSYANPAEPLRLTELGYSHTVALNSDFTMFVTTYSSVDTPPQSAVCKIEFDLQGVLSVSTCCTLMEPPVCPNYRAPELFHFQSTNGYTMHGMFYRPHNYRPGVRYPTVLFVYGGPQVQLVTNSFKGLKFLRLHTLASQGYAVVMLDNRGSCNRGMAFEGCIKNNLGTLEVDDQVEGLQWLASNVDFIDLSRVAIHGWSYGGYLALMGLVQRPEVFKVAIAGAPVVSWRLYDTGYTERYMSMPEENENGYKQGSILTYLDRFPDEENRLLIVHGLIDENVHFHHTSQLVSALVKACKPHRLQVYPNERHGIRSHESNEHYKTLVLSFLQDNL
nr:hypothetical protein BaRGS_011006 [Batillaria attramentaria]